MRKGNNEARWQDPLKMLLYQREVCEKVIELAKGVENESPIHTAILLYKKGLSADGHASSRSTGIQQHNEEDEWAF